MAVRSGDCAPGLRRREPVRRRLDAQALPESGAFILLAKEAPRLQDRDHLVDEDGKLARQGLLHHETVAGAGLEPGLELVGDLLGRAGELSLWRGEAQGDLSQAEFL